MRASANEGESESEKNAKKKGKRRQADKQMKFINMLLITSDNATDRARGHPKGRGRYAMLCAVYAFCIQIAKLMSKTQPRSK